MTSATGNNLNLRMARWWRRVKVMRMWLRLLLYSWHLVVFCCWGWRSDSRDLLRSNANALYSCPFNSMCHCLSLPNDTAILDISCNEICLYKFPEFLHNNVRHIEISKTRLQTIDDETFQGLRLESLKLTENDLHEFAAKSFNSMTHSLMTLDVSGNSLQTLCLEALRIVHTLNRLIAQRNQIENLDGNWGSLAESLRSLHLSGNAITEVNFSFDERRNYSSSHGSGQQIKTFSKLRKLMWLDLSGNRITHIAANSLPRGLVTVDLGRNLLQTFPFQAFQHLRDLKVISLKDNLLTTANINWEGVELMTNKLHLEKMDFSANSLEELPDKMFEGESLFRVKAINFDRNFIRRIPGNIFENSGIVHMVLAFNYIDDVDELAFHGLETSLEYLDLERNFLSNISIAFQALKKIRFLYLTGNELDHISTSLPPTIRVLSLASNNFSQIPVIALENCTELSYLNLGYNKISDLAENVFTGGWGSELQTLLLRNNKITSLNYGSFNGLDSIKEISLSFNDIHYLHPSTFYNISKTLKILELSFGIYREDIPLEALNPLTELMWLGLDNNNFKLIPDDSLITLRELTYINLAFNRIGILPRTIFMPEIHRNLMEIDLSFNLIERIFTNTFDELVMLQFINLGSNKVRLIERHSFHNLPYLTSVDLSYNELKNISDAAFAFLPNLITLDLTFNHLANLPFKIFRHVSNYTTPLHVNCSHNLLVRVDGELSSHLFINTLDLSHNQLSETGSFANIRDSLRFLHLNHNNISILNSHAFGDLEKLFFLNLSANNISQMRRRSFQGLANLQELDLSDNKLETLQFEQFSTLRKLRILNLAKNRFRSIPRDSFINTRIEMLDLSDNQLTLWPVNAFSDIGFTLRMIRLDGNHLEYLDATMFGNINFLLKLSLSRNRITVLPDNTFIHLSNLTELDLSHNPLVVTNFRELFSYVPRLRRLNLRAAELTALPFMIGIPELIELDVSENQIQDIGALKELQKLRVLRLAQNKLVNLTHFGKYVPQYLRVLDLSHNPIRKISMHDFGQTRFLDELSVENIKLPIDIFARLKNLRTLRISAQHNLGEIVGRVKSLRSLHVNVINEETLDERLFDPLSNNTKLNLVEITGQNLKLLPSSTFDGLARSQELTVKVHGTQINDLPPGLFYALKHVPRLTIDISNNLIATLAPDTFYPNNSAWDAVGTRSIIGGLDVHSNPLQCDCGLVWVGHWLRRWLRESSQINPISKEETRNLIRRARRNNCIDPTSGKRLTFLEIFPEDLLCHASALSSFAHRFDNKFCGLTISTVQLILATVVPKLFSYFLYDYI